MLYIACSSELLAQTAKNRRPLTATDNETWVIRWDRSDDFNGDEIDWRKWHKSPENWGAWTWDNQSNATATDGVLTLTMRYQPKTGLDGVGSKRNSSPYTSGMLKSYRTGTYGYYEARIKGAPLFPGVCPGFWLYSRIDDSLVDAGKVRYSEIDIVEMTQRGALVPGNERVTDHNLHTIISNGNAGLAGREWRRPNDERFKDNQANEYKAPFDPRDDFHTYGCKVTSDKITWYVDGVQVGSKKNEHWHRDMNVALSLALRPPYARWTTKGFVPVADQPTENFPTSMSIDYVRVWELSK
ncbi:MAG: family 16 glycosylhydrolase [Rhodopirellula sp. JB053]